MRWTDFGLGVLLGLLVQCGVGWILTALPVVIDDLALAGMVLGSVVFAVVLAAVICWLSRRRPRPFGLVVGAATGPVLLVLVIGAGAGLLGWLLSDPAGATPVGHFRW